MGTAAGRRSGPARSATAARAHEAGDVTWVIDLGRSPAARVSDSVEASRRYGLAGLSLIAVALWTFDLAVLLMRAG